MNTIKLRAFTHPSVLAGITAGAHWADPVMNPVQIDWAPRQAAALIPFELKDGRPVNPCESTGIRYGRNEFGHWGEAAMADALVTAAYQGGRYLLMVERGDGHGWAVPGGHVDDDESGMQAAHRELEEETGLTTAGVVAASGHPVLSRVMPARYVPDPRASDEAWAVTVPVAVDLGPLDQLPAVTGADDARRAEWVPADSYEALETALRAAYGGSVFAAHRDMLREFLG